MEIGQENQEERLISVCIPTYNRATIVYDCVRQILTYKGGDLEVVVGDNCSPDKTRELITAIKDERISYFRNDTNIGYVNILETIKHAHGEYCILLSDEDDLILENIQKLKKLLKEAKHVAVMVTGIEELSEKVLTFSAGKDAVFQNVLHMPGYMSGQIFKRKSVCGERVLDKICKEELFFQLFPHQYVAALCCVDGDLLFTGRHFVRIGARKGKTDNGGAEVRITGMHWEPASRLQQVSGRLRLLHKCGLDLKTRTHVGLILLKNYTITSSIGFYKILCEDMTLWNMSEEKIEKLSKIYYQPAKFWHEMIWGNYREIRKMLEKELLEVKLAKALLRYPQYLLLYYKGKLKIRIEEKRWIHHGTFGGGYTEK